MRYILLLLAIGCLPYSIKAQDFDIGVHAGVFTPMDLWFYADGEVGPQVGVNFKYHKNEQWAISSNYFRGHFGYSPAQTALRRSGQLIGPEATNVSMNILSFLVHRSFTLRSDWKLSVGTGVGYFIENRNAGQTSRIDPFSLVSYRRDFTMPWNFNVSKEVSSNMALGINSGFFTSLFYRFGGFHVGPSISYRL